MADEAIDTMFEDAVDALRQGDQPKAKQILTGLLKADQSNANYWVWMSAAVETTKERIYCLETALKLDPENATAKRGLVLLGGRAADENIQPFPLNRPRAWEEDLLLAHEKPQEKGMRAMMSSSTGAPRCHWPGRRAGLRACNVWHSEPAQPPAPSRSPGWHRRSRRRPSH